MDAWQQRLARIHEIDNQVATMQDMLKELIAEVVEPKRAAIKALEAERAQLKLQLDVEAVASVEAGGPQTFGGVQVRRSSALEIADAAAAVAALRGVVHRERPLVREELDKAALAAYLRAGGTAPGVRLAEGWSVALLGTPAPAAEEVDDDA